MDWKTHKHDIIKCRKCGISKLCSNRKVTYTFRNQDSNEPKLMFVGEAPGRTEFILEEPFSGPSGTLLNSIIFEAGIINHPMLFTNVVLCTPFFDEDLDEIRTPTKEEIDNCSENLFKTIYLWKPELIFAVGKVAARALTAMTIPHVPLIHPAAILRQSTQELDFKRTALKISLEVGKL